MNDFQAVKTQSISDLDAHHIGRSLIQTHQETLLIILGTKLRLDNSVTFYWLEKNLAFRVGWSDVPYSLGIVRLLYVLYATGKIGPCEIIPFIWMYPFIQAWIDQHCVSKLHVLREPIEG